MRAWGVGLAILFALSGCATPEPPSGEPAAREPIAHAVRATLHTGAGDIVLELAREQVPATVEHFLALARSGFYDGTRFHRISSGFVIQGGDPHSRTEDRSTWGYGGREFTLPDEMNPTLRHSLAGTVSLATTGRDTGGSQFFITLSPQTRLDDQFPVFGRVASGMDVVEAIARAPTEGGVADGAPVEPVAIDRITIEEPAPVRPERGVAVFSVSNERQVARGTTATFALVLRNTGDARDNFTLTAQHAAGWRVSLERERVELAAGRGAVVLVEVDPPDELVELAGVQVTVGPEGDAARRGHWPLLVRPGAIGAEPVAGADVRVNYVVLLTDGRLVDTNIERVGRANMLPAYAAFGPRASYEPYSFTLGEGVIAGFSALAARTPVGASGVARVPAIEGYADEPMRGRDLVIEMEMLAVE